MEEINTRKEEGTTLLLEHLTTIGDIAGDFLGSVKGFRRDFALSQKTCPEYIEADFLSTDNALVVPPLTTARSFADLRQMLGLVEDAINGKIIINNPPLGPDRGLRGKLAQEIEIIHRNLLEVAESAQRLYESIQRAGLDFDMFNTKNLEVGVPDVNIMFDRDELNVAMSTARALGERAIRMDIDLVEAKSRMINGQKQTK